MSDQLIVKGEVPKEPGTPDPTKPKELESPPPVARGETTKTAINKLSESLKTGFGRLEQQLGNPAKQASRPAAPAFFPAAGAAPASVSPLAGPVTRAAAQPAVLAFKGVTAEKSADLSFATPRALEARAAIKGKSATPAALPVAQAAQAGRSEVTRVTSPQASPAAPAAAFAGQPRQEPMPRALESSNRTASSFIGQKSSPAQAPSAMPAMAAPAASFAGMPTMSKQGVTAPPQAETASPTRYSPAVQSSLTPPTVKGFESNGQRVGFRTSPSTPPASSSTGVSAAAVVPSTPSAFTPKSIDATAFARFGSMRPMERSAMAGSRAGAPAAAEKPFNKQDPGTLAAQEFAPGVSAKPGQLNSINATKATAGALQPFASHPNLAAARSEQKSNSEAAASKDIKKAPWGNDKVQREMLDTLKSIETTLKKRDD